MLIPKKDLARSSGMMQIGQAISSILTPVIAGAAYGFIGLRGIVLIDAVTYEVPRKTHLLSRKGRLR